MHQKVPIDVSEASHGARGDHVENHLMGGASFHAGGSRENFGADLRHDGEVGGPFEGGVGIAGESDGVGSATVGVFDGSESEGSASAGGDADYDIVLARLAVFDFGEGEAGGGPAGLGGGRGRDWAA